MKRERERERESRASGCMITLGSRNGKRIIKKANYSKPICLAYERILSFISDNLTFK